MSPGTMFQQQPYAHPHLKGDDDNEEKIISTNEKIYEGINCEELVDQLKDTEALHEQADIIHYLYTHKYVRLILLTTSICTLASTYS